MSIQQTFRKTIDGIKKFPMNTVRFFKGLQEEANKRPPIPEKGILGVTGIDITGSYIQDEELGNLETLEDRCPVYDEMEKQEGAVRLSLLCYKKPICSAKFDIVLEDEGKMPAKQRDDLINYARKLFVANPFYSWKYKLNEILDYIKYGVSVFETDSIVVDNQWVMKDMYYRHPKTILWQFDSENNLTHIEQTNYTGNKQPEPIKRDKLIIFNNEKKGDNWDGIGMCRYQYRPYSLIKIILKLIVQGLSRYLIAEPRVEAPKGVGVQSNEWLEMQKAISAIRSGSQTGMIFPFGWKDLTKEMNMTGFTAAKMIIEMLKKDIFWGAMTQHAMLAGGAAGSWALSKDATDFFGMAIQAELDLICDTLNHVIRYYVSLNYHTKIFPKMRAIISEEDVHQWLLDTILTFEKQVLPVYPEAQNMVIQRLDLPEKDMVKFQEEQAKRQEELMKQEADKLEKEGLPGEPEEEEEDKEPDKEPEKELPPKDKEKTDESQSDHIHICEEENPFWREATEREEAIGGIKYFKEKKKFIEDSQKALKTALTPVMNNQMNAVLTYSKKHDIKQLMKMEVPDGETFRKITETFLKSSMMEGLNSVVAEAKKLDKEISAETVAKTKKRIEDISREKSYIAEGKNSMDLKNFLANKIVTEPEAVEKEDKSEMSEQLLNMAIMSITGIVGIR